MWNHSGANATALEGASLFRGVQVMLTNIKNSGLTLTNTTIKDLGKIKSVSLNVSANLAGASIGGIKVGDVSLLCNSKASYTISKNNNQTPEFTTTTPTSGDVVISFTSTATSKSLYIKSISVTYETEDQNPDPTTGTLTFKAESSEGYYYATFSSDKDVVFTEDVVVKTANVNGNALTITDLDADTYEVTDSKEASIKGYYVPANTGVLVNSLEETATYYFPKTAQPITFDDNALKPAPAEGGVFTAEADYKYYKLAYDDYNAKTGLGFYWGADNGAAFSVKAGTAYLAVPAAVGNAKGFLLDGSATGINNLNKANVNDKQIYNIAGQRVATMRAAGLYIVNGKKVVIRK